MSPETIIRICKISKQFPGVQALSNISLDIYKGEILAMVGENGAGKSTLVRILAGAYPKTSYTGEFYLDNDIQDYKNPKNAQQAGIAMIHQELMLIKDMNIAENIFLGRWPSKMGLVNFKEIHSKAKQQLFDLGLDINTKTTLNKLGVSQLQLLEIAKALSQNSRVLILDEPTASLTDIEVNKLFDILRTLRNKGVTIIYISHRLKEIFKIADRVAVLRDGKLIGVDFTGNLNYNSVVSMMIGRELTKTFPALDSDIKDIALEVKSFSVKNSNNQYKIHNVSFSVRRGEILGLSGLLGAGRTELASALFGAYKGGISAGEVLIDGKSIKIKNPRDAIKNGLAMVTEDRQNTGIIKLMNICENTTITILKSLKNKIGLLSKQNERNKVLSYVNELKIKVSDIFAPITTLSGGNQQKVLVARWLATQPKILILDEPTRGIDVEAKAEVYQLMRELTKKGLAIIMISSDLLEILEVSDRILVMCEGKITGEFLHSEATEELIMSCATGTNSN